MKIRPLRCIASARAVAHYRRRGFRLPARIVRAAAAFAMSLACIAVPAASPEVVVIPVVGAIGPASADFIVRGLMRAAHDKAQLAVVELDTPGGLDTSMRQIIKAILASPVPVAAFIAPSGARAASAGTYIVYASHVAAMAPGTTLGAATPIELGGGGTPGAPPAPSPAATGKDGGGDKPASAPKAVDTQSTEARKRIDDAAAYIRGL